MTPHHRRPLLSVLVALATCLATGLALLAGPAAPAEARVSPILFGLHDHTDADRLATQRALHKRSALVGYFVGWDRGLPSARYLNAWSTNRGAVHVIATGQDAASSASLVTTFQLRAVAAPTSLPVASRASLLSCTPLGSQR